MGIFPKTDAGKTAEAKQPVKGSAGQAKAKPAKAKTAKAKTVKATAAGKATKDLYGSEKPAEAKQGQAAKPLLTDRPYRVLVKPLITEKAANSAADSQYYFEVSPQANKIEVAKAISELYGIKPLSVNILNRPGKKVRFGRRFGRRKDMKRAVVTLPKGKTINIYEGV